MAKTKNKIKMTVGSGNVFKDLGFPNAEELHTKVGLAVAINQLIESKRLTQAEAAKRLKVSQPKVSALLNYRLEGFSVERLMKYLNALGSDVVIMVRKVHTRRPAKINVIAA